MIEIDVLYRGELRTTACHGPSAAELFTDAPRDNQGQGQSFSPTDLLATALGTCILTIMGIEARKRDLALEGARARVEKHMVADPHRRIGRLVVDITLPATLSPADRAALEQAGRGCPVCRSLSPQIDITITFRSADR